MSSTGQSSPSVFSTKMISFLSTKILNSFSSSNSTDSYSNNVTKKLNDNVDRKQENCVENSSKSLQNIPHHKKQLILKNLESKTSTCDTLHSRVAAPVTCMSSVCLGSVMGTRGRDTGESRSAEEVLQHAKDFLDQYYSSIRRNGSAGHIARWNQIQEEVTKTGSYQLTETELVYGAKLAWRNSSRCIGRIQWSKLQVFDCRYVTSTSGMFDALCNHIKYSTNKGNIRSALTVFPQRTDGNHDFRIWNAQLVGYAGYRQPDGSVFGDPLNVDFTDVCIKLGWKSKGTRFDILPLVLSADGEDPDYFDIPPELIMEIPLSHPIYPWFTDLDLKWYALPAVANMMFDCGGIEFTAAPFNGWYMSSEIACRDLCDSSRYNVLEPIATRMGLDTRAAVTLWRDRALVECNVAVLYSFQLHNVTIVDHHTASESFMKHYENEFRLRGGCPADWVWIVPPLSGSITPVFHQEMALYHLKPSYEYQDQPWRGYTWKKNKDHLNNKTTRKFHFKQVARAVKFTSKLFGQALSRRIKATVLFATETGKSEMFAKKLCDIFRHAFNAKVYCMSEYDFSNIEHEAMLLVVTSTFGNGDPPENGEIFAQHLYSLKMRDDSFRNDDNGDNVALISPKSFIKANSQQDITNKPPQLDRLDSLRGTYNMENTFGPLSNVRFSVFALGSSAYPNFCAFGKFVDNILGELGGERLMPMTTGDEICGQEQAFWKWASEVFNVSCETFCIDDIDTNLEPSYFFNTEPLSKSNVRFVKGKEQQLETSLAKSHNKKVTCCKLLKRINLHEENASRTTFNVQFEIKLPYKPGDHVGICACNNSKIVDGILSRLEGVQDPDEIVQLELLKDINTPQGITQSWEAHDRLPPCSIRTLFTRILDLTTPASPNLLQYFSTIASKLVEKDRLYLLATDSSVYEEWRHRRFPHLLEVLEEFSSVRPHVALLAGQLNILQPRFYSISSSPLVFPDQVHLTVAAVSYRTDDGEGPIHYGVCSNYLQTIPEQSDVYLFVRSAIGFHLPSDHTKPIILVGPGTGIAPFRGFWQHRLSEINSGISDTGKMWLFFGCRGKYLDLYMDEKSEMLEKKVLDRVFLALSREPDIPKTYVQDLLLKEAENVYNLLVKEQGHFYVCGDCTMAEHVYQTLKKIIQQYGNLSDADVEKYVLTLRDENRYHEDIFGITLRTTEVHNRSRVSARIKMIS